MGPMMGASLGSVRAKLGPIMAAENSKWPKLGPIMGTEKPKLEPMLGAIMGSESPGFGPSWIEAMALPSAHHNL